MQNINKEEADILIAIDTDAKEKDSVEDTGCGGITIIKNKAGEPINHVSTTNISATRIADIEEIP